MHSQSHSHILYSKLSSVSLYLELRINTNILIQVAHILPSSTFHNRISGRIHDILSSPVRKILFLAFVFTYTLKYTLQELIVCIIIFSGDNVSSFFRQSVCHGRGGLSGEPMRARLIIYLQYFWYFLCHVPCCNAIKFNCCCCCRNEHCRDSKK